MVVSVPATSANLGPGFDTLGLSINLRNRVKIKPSRFFSMSIKGEGENNPKIKANNIFINIFYEHYQKLTGRRDNFRFAFYNNIPISRGLGSSSAVVISALASAYRMANVKISKEKILEYALVFESHPDNITPAVMGGFTVSVVENNKVFYQKADIPNYLKAIMVIPNKAISTAHSRTSLPKRYSKEDTTFNVSRSSFLTSLFFTKKWDFLRMASKDKMHQYYRMNNLPDLFKVQEIALNNGALMSTLSGSGSSFFSMAYVDDTYHIKKRLKKAFPNFYVDVFDFDNRGVFSK